MYLSTTRFASQLSQLSSLKEESEQEDYVQPHYKEAYRLAIYALLNGGKEAYHDFLKKEQLGDFLSEKELLHILQNVKCPAKLDYAEENEDIVDDTCSTGTYWPVESDFETPDLDLGWPEVMQEIKGTNINLLFHPPRHNSPTIKEVIRKQIQDARQVIAIVMDIFTDVDIFKDIVDATLRGVAVYVLLDDFQINSFLTMAENQDIQIQRLKNMRVRSVKGLDYLCRSGAKFHGGLAQKFLLVDCQTVVYGSYSFMWSYEKINLSMVQVITGQLVRSFDEEFRILFARSTVPTVFSQDSLLLDDRHNGTSSVGSYAPHFSQHFERKGQLKHTLDMVYMRTCRTRPNIKYCAMEFEDKLYNQQLADDRSRINGNISKLHKNQHEETNNSYAGGRQESADNPNHSKYKASKWNVIKDEVDDGTPGRVDYLSKCMEDPVQSGRLSHLYKRDIIMRQPYHGTDKQAISMQQNFPTMEHTTMSILQKRGLHSYINSDISNNNISNSSDYLVKPGTQYDRLDSRLNQYIPSRLRSSLVFNSKIPEHPESNNHTANFTSSTLQDDHCGSSKKGPSDSSVQWNPMKSTENQMGQDDLIQRRHTHHKFDEPASSKNLVPEEYPCHPVYASLGRARWKQSVKNPDMHKRYSLTTPKPNAENSISKDSVSHTLERGQPKETGLERRDKGDMYTPNDFTDIQRSVSHYDIKNVAEKKNPSAYNWQDFPVRTVSTTSLRGCMIEPLLKSSNFATHCFFEKGYKNLHSISFIAEKKGDSTHSKMGSGLKTSINMLSEEDKIIIKEKEVYNPPDQIQLVDVASHPRADVMLPVEADHFSDEREESSAMPRHMKLQSQDAKNSLPSNVAIEKPEYGTVQNSRSGITPEAWRRDHRGENRVYSRFEPFCTFEKKISDQSTTATSTIHLAERHRILFTSNPKNNIAYQTQTRNDNRFGRFMQRMGNLIHKNKQ